MEGVVVTAKIRSGITWVSGFRVGGESTQAGATNDATESRRREEQFAKQDRGKQKQKLEENDDTKRFQMAP